MVDDLNSSQPDDPQFVLSARAADESVRDYAARIDVETQRLMNVPRRSSS